MLNLGGPGSSRLPFGYVPGTGVSAFGSPLSVIIPGLSLVTLIIFLKFLRDSSLAWVSV